MATNHDMLARLRGLTDQARAFAVRRRLGWRHGAATGVVVLAGVVLMGAANAALGDGPDPIDPSERLKIEVVQPVEPVFTSGPVMDVGTLVDGFEPGMLRQASVSGPDPLLIDPNFDEEPKGGGGFFRRFTSAIQQALPREERSPPPRIRRDDRAYGFDEPRPDWQAEREARRAWRERIEAERRAERAMRDRYERERYERERYERDRYERDRYERDRYEAERRDRRQMRQRMDEPPPYDAYDEEPVG